MAEAADGRIDGEGRLVAAAPRLLVLQRAAGAALGEPLAVPALARVARLAQMLGIAISRRVLVADEDGDFDVSVSAQPAGGAVSLLLEGWAPRNTIGTFEDAASDDVEAPLPPTAASWSTDAALRLTAVPPGLDPALGAPLTRIFRLVEDDRGHLPILDAVAAASSFADQPVVLRARPHDEFIMSARALSGADGSFAGFEGRIEPRVSPATAQTDGASDLTRRLDTLLRTALGRIAAQADAIRAQTEGPLRRDYAEYAGDIASAARHLLALVDDLEDLEAIERPDFSVEVEPIDLADLARRAAGLLQVRAADNAVRIDRPAAGEILMAKGDFRRTLQILINLIGNAVRYSPRDSVIWIRSECDDDTVVLIVADQGKGIDPADHARIFEKFERVDSSEPGGNGLGLYIARRLARAMGGDIAVDSAPGQGARFALTLPAA